MKVKMKTIKKILKWTIGSFIIALLLIISFGNWINNEQFVLLSCSTHNDKNCLSNLTTNYKFYQQIQSDNILAILSDKNSILLIIGNNKNINFIQSIKCSLFVDKYKNSCYNFFYKNGENLKRIEFLEFENLSKSNIPIIKIF